MKITSSPSPAAFIPVSITITMESQDEVDAIYALLMSHLLHAAASNAFGVMLPNPETILSPSSRQVTLHLHDRLARHFSA